MKLTMRFLSLLFGFSVVLSVVAAMRGNDPFSPGGPIAASLAVLVFILPVIAIIDLVRLWRERGRAGDSAPRRPQRQEP